MTMVGLALAVTGALVGWTASRGGSPARPSRNQGALDSFLHWFDPAVARTEVPTLTLDIKFRHLQALRDRRAAWLASSARLADEGNETSASVRYGGRPVDVTVALAGTPLDKGPFELGRLRIAVKGEGDLFGMKKLLLDDPERPEFLHEALFYAALQRAGLLAPKVQAVQLVVNGKVWGIAMAVEQPSVEALALHQHPDGVMLGWDPPLQPRGNQDALAWLDPRTIDPVVEEARRIVGTPLADQAGLAVTGLRDLMRGTAPAEQVVDVQKTARFLAICEVWGMSRALQWTEMRWVMHPVTLRLEPFVRLPSGAAAGRLADGMAVVQRLLESTTFRAQYEAALRDEAKTLDAKAIARLAQTVAPHWPAMADLDVQTSTLPVLARARQVRDVASLAFLPGPATVPQQNPIAVPVPLNQVMPFARVDDAHKQVTVPTGEWPVPATVQLPEGYALHLQAGTQLRVATGAWILVHGPVTAEGTAKQPVELTGQLLDGKAQAWGGLLIIGGTGTHWRHVVVRDAAGAGQGSWQPRGAVVLVEGDADLADVRWQDIGGDAAGLRSVGTRLRVERAVFEHIGGSAMQVELTHADITDVQVRGAGGDGLDCVDTTATIKQLQVADTAGAAVRAGRQSELDVRGLDGVRLGNGLVAHDGAVVHASASRIADVRHLGYLAYNQSAGMPPARIDAQDVQVQGAQQAHLCTGGAVVSVQGRAQDCTAVSVQQLVAAGITRR
jgi:hypothetical protein